LSFWLLTISEVQPVADEGAPGSKRQPVHASIKRDGRNNLDEFRIGTEPERVHPQMVDLRIEQTH